MEALKGCIKLLIFFSVSMLPAPHNPMLSCCSSVVDLDPTKSWGSSVPAPAAPNFSWRQSGNKCQGFPHHNTYILACCQLKFSYSTSQSFLVSYNIYLWISGPSDDSVDDVLFFGGLLVIFNINWLLGRPIGIIVVPWQQGTSLSFAPYHWDLEVFALVNRCSDLEGIPPLLVALL